jgi:ATP-dependent exoDNAse (exonuclease V) alpha subunit
MIDDPSHLYITDDYVVTHNTFTLTMAMADLFRRGTNLVIVAPTHLARLNLIEKLPADIRHRVPTMTVAALLSRFGYDQGDGTTRFTSPSAKKLNEYDLIAIDEVSMLGQKDYDVLKMAKTKMIFSGDFAQLPAVMAKSAKTDMLEGDDEYRPLHYHFTEQMRQIGVIHQVAERNRNEVFYPTETLVGEQGEKVIVHDSRDLMVKTMINDITSGCGNISESTRYRYICHTNDGVSETNDAIRSNLIPHFLNTPANAHFVVGEPLMLYENLRIAYNGEVVTVVDVWRDPRYSFVNPYPWESYKMLIESSNGVTQEITAIPPRHRPMFKRYFEQLQSDLHRAKINCRTSQADEIFEEIQHLKNYWKNINYPYAVTCHKSQGMTIPHVFVDTLSFSKAPNKKSLLYVGLSRASLSLHTVYVPQCPLEYARKVNARYRQAREIYETLTGGSYLDVKKKIGLSTRTAQEKEVFTDYLLAVIADLEQGD